MKINLKNKKKTKVDQESIWYIHFNLISENETGNKLRLLLIKTKTQSKTG